MHCSRILTNADKLSYMRVVELLTVVEKDIPPEHLCEIWIFEQLDNAIILAEQECQTSPIYDALIKPVLSLISKDVKINVRLSHNTPYRLQTENYTICLPLVTYEINLCPLLIPPRTM